MMTNWTEMQKLADLLIAARRAGQQIEGPFPSELMPPDADTGYAVNALVAAGLAWQPLSWKIAGTTDDVRKKLRISNPIYGRTYRQFAAESPTTLVHWELLDPLVECEFFVTLAQPLESRDEPWTMEEICAAVGSVHAGVEVAECRFSMKALPSLPAILADGSASGRYIYGSAISEPLSALPDVQVELKVDGVAIRRGSGVDVMGHPITPLLWLAEERRRNGFGLAAGEMISTGSCTGMLPARAGQNVRVTFGSDAIVDITFET